MAIKDLVSGAWQEASTLKVPVSGAYQEADHANALVSGAWQEVWSNGYYFLKNGVLMNGAKTYSTATQGTNSISLYAEDSNQELLMVRFYLSSDMAGKRLYVRTNMKTRSETSYGYLYFQYPNDSMSSSGIWCENRAGDLLYMNLDSYMVSYTERQAYLGVGNSSSYETYHIYDIFVA